MDSSLEKNVDETGQTSSSNGSGGGGAGPLKKKTKTDLGSESASLGKEDDSEEEEEEDDDDDDDERSSEDENVPEIGLDQHGRIVPGVEGNVNYGFRAIENCVNKTYWNDLVNDCEKVFTARQAEDDEAYSAGETFFIKANQDPRCALEELAQDIFKFHSAGLTFDQEKSGAEWWTLVLEDDSDVAFHWDKDYGLEDYGVNVYPHISTVTYLSEVGGPTLVLEKTAPPRITDDFSGPAGENAFCSKPKVGKHISFDGRMLHYASNDVLGLFGVQETMKVEAAAAAAAAGEEEEEEEEEDQQGQQEKENAPERRRVTFLVNIWFNHIPRDAELLPSGVAESMTSPMGSETSKLWTGNESTGTQKPTTCEILSKSPFTEHFYECGDETISYSVRLRVPKVPTGNSSDSLHLKFMDAAVMPIIKKIEQN